MAYSISRFFALVPLILSIAGCFVPKVINQEKILFNDLVANNDQVYRYTLENGQDRLFYAAAGDPKKPAIIVIHGTPGDWRQYARYLVDEELLKNFYVLVIDRPGWGQSFLGSEKKIASFGEQAKIISLLAEKLKSDSDDQPVILMGHSLGASIAPKVAMHYPHSVDGLLLFAGTLSPRLSDPRWFNHLAKMPGVNFIIGDMMRRSNEEILALKTEMTLMAAQWDTVKAETLVVQGMKDKFVYPKNIEFAETYLNANVTEVIRLQEEGHLFPMTRRDDVVMWAVCLLKKINAEVNGCEA
ncbi:MAG: pimeloyl-ACP methyl ester carboxylesterase [Cellvibrionaceae bacterium]|jgi:pimeloyl-ACP methyl ester carboxylesterase